MRRLLKAALALPVFAAALALSGCFAQPAAPTDVTDTSAILHTSRTSTNCAAGDSGYYFWETRPWYPISSHGPWTRYPNRDYSQACANQNLSGLDLQEKITGLNPGTVYQYRLCGKSPNTVYIYGQTFAQIFGPEMCIGDDGASSLSSATSDPGRPLGATENADGEVTNHGNAFVTSKNGVFPSCTGDYGKLAPGPGNIDMNHDGYCEPPGTTVFGASFFVGINDPDTSADDRFKCNVATDGTHCQPVDTIIGDAYGHPEVYPWQNDLGAGVNTVPEEGAPGWQLYATGLNAQGSFSTGKGACIQSHPHFHEVNILNQELFKVWAVGKQCIVGDGPKQQGTVSGTNYGPLTVGVDVQPTGSSHGWYYAGQTPVKSKVVPDGLPGYQEVQTKTIVNFKRKVCIDVGVFTECDIWQSVRRALKGFYYSGPGTDIIRVGWYPNG